MKKYLSLSAFLLFMTIVHKSIAQTSDLSTTIDQRAFDKIVNSIDIPFTLFEHIDPFHGLMAEKQDFKDYSAPYDKEYTFEQTKNLFKWAVENSNVKGLEDNPNDIYKNAILQQWIAFKKSVDSAIVVYQNPPKNQSIDFQNLTIEDLKKLQSGNVDQVFKVFEDASTKFNTKGFEAKAHLAYAKVELVDRPKLAVNSPQFSVANIKVKATATGELWVNMPALECCRWFGPFCFCYRVNWHWIRIAQLTVSPQIGADITTVFSIEQMKIMATGRFDRLYLDYNIIRDINLAGIGNFYLSKKKFELYDVSQFVASIPYINKKFTIADIRLPKQSSGIKVEVDIK